ncbi:MAG: enoyl-CoA hydratase/isomerase family protein [Pseudomonadota bacterium]
MSDINSQLSDGIKTITFNRPDSLNAFTPDMLHELADALKDAETDSSVKVLVIEGAGRAFSAGVDLKVLQGINPVAGKIGDVFDSVAEEISNLVRNHRAPVIAKVHGACFTGALEIALSCDFIIAEASAKFGDTHAKWGLRPTWGMGQNLARAVGVRRARQLSFSAQVFSGQQAADWGLANESVDGLEALSERVTKIASDIAAGSPGAVNAYKTLYRLHEEYLPLEKALQSENALTFPQIDDTNERLGGFGS